MPRDDRRAGRWKRDVDMLACYHGRVVEQRGGKWVLLCPRRDRPPVFAPVVPIDPCAFSKLEDSLLHVDWATFLVRNGTENAPTPRALSKWPAPVIVRAERKNPKPR